MGNRKTPRLDLKPETAQVVAQDFNLFYKPEAEPAIAGMEQFTNSLSNFVSGAGTDLAIVGEMREKKVNEAEAVKSYNENRGKFNTLVKNGTIPKEANPYFIEKFKGLELNDQAEQFKAHLYLEYGKNQVNLNTNPDGFTDFYNKTLKKWVKDNQLGMYDPLQLNKEFFTKTDGIRRELSSRHSSEQLSKINKDYKKKAINGIQSFFEDDGSEDFYIKSGKKLSDYIKDMTANGLSNETAQGYLFEALEEYIQSTDDTEGARKLLTEMPNHIVLGTGAFGDIKGLQDDFNRLEDKLLDREIDNEERATKLEAAKVLKERRFVRAEINKPDFDFQEFKETDEYNVLSNDAKDLAEQYYLKGQGAFAAKDNIEVKNKITELLKQAKYKEAEEYLLEIGSTQLREVTYNQMRDSITFYEATGTSGELENDSYKFYKKDIETRIALVNKGGIIISPDIGQKFEARARRWLLENKDNYTTPFSGSLEDAFEDWLTKQYNKTLLIISGNATPDGEVKKESFDESKITSKAETKAKRETANLNKLPRGEKARKLKEKRIEELEETKTIYKGTKTKRGQS